MSGIPKPVGYKILVRHQIEKKTESGIIFSEYTTERRAKVELEAEVVALGSLAYSDQGGPWCKEGDIVIIKPLAGDYFDEGEYRYRFIYDVDVHGISKEGQMKAEGKNLLIKPVIEKSGNVTLSKDAAILQGSDNQKFEIVDIGDEVFRDKEPYLKIGDVIRIDKYAGFNKGKDFRFIKLTEVNGVY